MGVSVRLAQKFSNTKRSSGVNVNAPGLSGTEHRQVDWRFPSDWGNCNITIDWEIEKHNKTIRVLQWALPDPCAYAEAPHGEIAIDFSKTKFLRKIQVHCA